MDIQLKNFGCLDMFGCVFSLGLLPVLLWMTTRKIPQKVTEEGIILASGEGVRWNDITTARITRFYVGRHGSKNYNESRVELTHPGGKVNFRTRRIYNETQVMQFIMSHLPQHIVSDTEL